MQGQSLLGPTGVSCPNICLDTINMFSSASRPICRLSRSLFRGNSRASLDTSIFIATLNNALSSCHRKLSQAASATDIEVSKLAIRTTDTPRAKVPASELKFGQTFTDHMLIVKWTRQNGWKAPEIKPYGNLEIDPSASVLQYATCLFEGMKAYKSSDGRIRLFRPEMNMKRMNQSARRLAFPSFEGEHLLELIKKLVKLDGDWVPTEAGHSLYIRPTIIGTGAGLGVGPPTELTLFVICSPVGPYYRTGFKPISLLASSKYCRAWPGGSGAFKLGANYPTGFLPQMEANSDGFEQILWLFGDHDHLTEVGTMNLFVALEDQSGMTELVTPPLDDKILPGVTRCSVLELLRNHLDGSQRLDGLPTKFKLSERPITMIEMLERSQSGRLKEVFGTGTAAIVSSVERIGYKGKDIHVPVGPAGLGLFANVIQREILGRQTGEIPSDWAVVI
ncbi:hypothetical protein PTTG_02405 [Puccinia triticina 1-1 BBBD Race 1]|uniref:Branched-chain-amino-acid aminotransferase n=2 Tax=Puccinia triticina TaxID=208348 RepID=A0A180H1Z9_PUCT1|nr:uncharacterized protein PtA15_4A268 [Puccinia triticina]OAV99057.1 hypothetical protein PTTG_02405 [Puccinia triticina 1-1 BBBD Race 1]WAQ83819.1 hypothetical protein PtA15_4A268 [Puccinia triticina]WAR54662.1 hypothetical protein PtB15_4B279 [Puccinia triticina]